MDEMKVPRKRLWAGGEWAAMPDWVTDVMPSMGGEEIKVLLVVGLCSSGWLDGDSSITLPELGVELSLSKEEIKKGLNAAISRGSVVVRHDRGGARYSLAPKCWWPSPDEVERLEAASTIPE